MGLILVIDDEQDTRIMVERLLVGWGHKALLANTGEEGLAMLAEEKPDLIIVDFMMPGINGVEFIRQLRANERTLKIPAILYTAVADPAFTNYILETGANEIWVKGRVEIEDMRKVIAKYVA